MLRTGIYVDGENVRLNGGFGIRYDILCKYVKIEGDRILRANIYLVEDEQALKDDEDKRKKLYRYYGSLRRTGFKIIRKKVKIYTDPEGNESRKANCDIEIAVDCLLQATNLDRVVLVTGDGDFIRLVTGLQNKGLRVDLISFKSVSRELARAVDHYNNGYLIPDLIPMNEEDKVLGVPSHDIDFFRSKHYGFLRFYRFDAASDKLVTDSAFVHSSELDPTITDEEFSDPSNIFSFEIAKNGGDFCHKDKIKGVHVNKWASRLVI